MRDHVLTQIGRKIRNIRRASAHTIQEVANKASVSKGLISKIENGRTVPSLPVLLDIIQALDTDIPTFFEGIEYVKYDGYVHKKPKEYLPLEKEASAGYHYQSILAQSFTNLSVEISLLDIMPNAQRALVTTDGYTYLYVLKGDLIYIMGEERLTLEMGDSLFFNGKIPHKPLNETHTTASLLVVYLLMPYME